MRIDFNPRRRKSICWHPSKTILESFFAPNLRQSRSKIFIKLSGQFNQMVPEVCVVSYVDTPGSKM